MVRLGDGTSKEAFGPEATMAPALSPRALGSRAKGDLSAESPLAPDGRLARLEGRGVPGLTGG